MQTWSSLDVTSSFSPLIYNMPQVDLRLHKTHFQSRVSFHVLSVWDIFLQISCGCSPFRPQPTIPFSESPSPEDLNLYSVSPPSPPSETVV